MPSADDPSDVSDCLGHVLVLPDAEDGPSEGGQMSVGLAVSFDVPCKFGRPPRAVVRGCRLVLGASVPEAAVDEHCDLGAGEKDVSTAPGHAWEGMVDAISEPESVEFAAQQQLRFGVACGLARHPRRGGGGHVGERTERSGAGTRCGVGSVCSRFATLTCYDDHRSIMHRAVTRKSPDAVVRTLDLFAGAGGLTTGLSSAPGLRIDPVAAVEFDKAAAATYTLNHGGHIVGGRLVGGPVYAGPIQDWLADVPPVEVDLVVGGPPCQGFSTLGKQDVDDERNFLWRKYAEAVQRSTPRYFVLENVPAFLTSPQWEVFRAELDGGMLADYRIDFGILNAADYGAVQARRRVIVIGHRKDQLAPGMPVKTHERHHLTLEEVFRRIPDRVDRVGLPDGTVWYEGKDRPGPFSTRQLHFGRNYTSLSLQRFARIPEKGNRFDLPDELLSPCWRKHRTGSGDVMGRLHLDKPSVTIRTEFFKPEKGRYLHPTEDRVITHYEAAMIQGFPLDYQWVGTREEIARQIGNAVPIPLGQAIGRQLLRAFVGTLEAGEGPRAA